MTLPRSSFSSAVCCSVLTVLLLLIGGKSIAQRPAPGNDFSKKKSGKTIKGKITGRIVDANAKSPIEFATVLLVDIQTEKHVAGTTASEDGSFKLPEVNTGSYLLIISFIGYQKNELPVAIDLKSPDINLGEIALKSTTKQLDEVVISSEKELIENKIDKTVYNAEQDVANSGGNAGDVLRRAPMVSVDLEGNVSLRGSQNVTILLNGKPSSILASSPADLLNVLPADEIKSIEVITTPTAKYDGEGSAGIINIITKKKELEGLAGNIYASAGTRRNNMVLGLNGGRARFGFNTSLSSYYSWPRKGRSDFIRTEDFDGDQRILTENGNIDSDRLGFSGRGGMYYDFNAYKSISGSFRFRGFRSGFDGIYDTEFIDETADEIQQYIRNTNGSRSRVGYEWNIDYISRFARNEEQELAISYKRDGNTRNNESFILQNDILGNDEGLFRDERNINDGDNLEHTLQLDYTHPIENVGKLEIGAKTVIRSVISDYGFSSRADENADYLISADQTDVFDYDQDVVAGYFSGQWEFGEKYTLITGIRYEQTTLRGRFQNTERPFENDYANLLPSMILSRKLGQSSVVKASYSKRIQRPGLRSLNPFVRLDNNRNISFGNPLLAPELTNQYELNFNTFKDKSSLNFSVYYRKTTEIIERFLSILQSGISETTYRNIGESNSIGSNVFASTKFFKTWTVRGGLNAYTYDASGVVFGEAVSNRAVLFGGNINSNLSLKNDWIIDASGFFRGRRQTIQGFNPSFSIFSMGIRKSIWDKKGSLGFSIVEPFFENKVFRSELEGNDFSQISESLIPFRSFGITFRYRFGKYKSSGQRKSRIKNDDQKSGDSGTQF